MSETATPVTNKAASAKGRVRAFFEAPPERLAALRVLIGAYGFIYLVARLPHLLSYGLDNLDRFRPVGILSGAETPIAPALYNGLVAITVLLSFAFFVGYRYRLLAPVFATTLLVVLTHSNSWGMILHTDNLLMLYVIMLSVAPAADAYSWDARAGRVRSRERSEYGWVIRLMCLVCGTAYLLAGIAKLRTSGLDFASGDTLRNYIAFDNVRKLELGSVYSPLGAALLPYAGFFAGLAWVSLVLEMVAPFAAFHRRFGQFWAIGIWAFHLGVLLLMAIGFVFQLTFIAFTPFFTVEKWLRRPRVQRILQRLRLTGPTETVPAPAD